MKYRESRGNVLFIILLGVVLIAALSMAIRGSTRGSGNNASSEKASAYASEIMQMGNLFASTVARLQINNECEDIEISFVNSIESGYTNSYTPSDGRCKVFDPAGGNLTWQTPPTEWLDPYFANSPWGASFQFGKILFPQSMSVDGIGTYSYPPSNNAQHDLYMTIPFVSDNICRAINTSLGLPYPLYSVQTTSLTTIKYFIDAGKFTGLYSGCSPSVCANTYSLADSTGKKILAPNFCVTGTWGFGVPESGKNLNAYVHTLITR